MFTLCQRYMLYVATIVIFKISQIWYLDSCETSHEYLCAHGCRLLHGLWVHCLRSMQAEKFQWPVYWCMELLRAAAVQSFFWNLGLQVHRAWPIVTSWRGRFFCFFFSFFLVFRFSSHFESSLAFFLLNGGYSKTPRKVTFSLEGGEVRSSTPMVSSWGWVFKLGFFFVAFPNCGPRPSTFAT